MTAANVPPHDLGAERAVLSTLLLDAKPWADVLASTLDADEFYLPDHAHVWRAAYEAHEAGEPIDAVTVAKRLRGRVQAVVPLLAELCDATPSVANVEAHANIVRQLAQVRRVIARFQGLVAEGYQGGADPESYLQRAATEAAAVAQGRTKGRVVTIRESITEAFAVLARATDHGVAGLSTGFGHLDTQTTGMHPGELWVVAGRPAMGKSAFAGALALGASVASNPDEQAAVLIVSLEMTHEQISQRLASGEASVSMQDARSGRIGPKSWQDLTQAAQWLVEQPIAFYDQPATLADINASARRYKHQIEATACHDGRKRRLALIIVDYMQLVVAADPRGTNREQQVAEVSRGLKRMAKELGACVVALSQLSRKCEERADKRPMLSDLRESGQLEQDADVVLFLYRDEYYNEKTQNPGTAEVILAKQRNGPTGTVRLGFDSRYTRFRPLELRDVDRGYQAAE